MKTKNYSQFKKHIANRKISEVLVKKLMISIKTFGYIPGRPVLVDKNFTVIDGQHRLEACKRLKIHVDYEISDAKLMEAVIALNSNQAQWKLIDYVTSHAEQGVDCYRRLLKFEEKYKFGISVSADLFLQLRFGNNSKILKEGKEFDINTQAEEVAEFLIGLNHLGFNKTRGFATAISFLFKKATPKQIAKVRERIMLVPFSTKMGDYVNFFENVINYGKSGSNRIKL